MKKLIYLSLLLCFCWTTTSTAQIVTDLYTAHIPVTSRDGRALNEGLQKALTQVLIKLSGQQNQVLQPTLQAKMGNANRFVQYFEYTTADQQLMLVTYFNQMAVDQLMQELDLARWEERRPTFLGWIAVAQPTLPSPVPVMPPEPPATLVPAPSALATEAVVEPVEQVITEAVSDTPANIDTPHTPSAILINEQQYPVAAHLLKTYALRRGLPILLPVLDLDDRRTLSAEQIQQADRNAILAAASRYGAKAMLTGAIAMQKRPATEEELAALAAAELPLDAENTETTTPAAVDEDPVADGYEEILIEEWQGQWQLYVDNQPFNWQHQAKSLEGLIAASVDQAVNYIADSVIATANATGTTANGEVSIIATADTFELHVTNVPNLQDYVRLQAYLNSLSTLEKLTMKAIRGGEVHFLVTLSGGNTAFQQLIARSRNLRPLPDAELRGEDVALYRFVE